METRARKAARENREANNAIGEHEIPIDNKTENGEPMWRQQLLTVIKEQHNLLNAFKAKQEDELFQIAERLTGETQRLWQEFEKLWSRQQESERMVAELAEKMQDFQQEVGSSQDRLLKGYTAILAWTHQSLKDEIAVKITGLIDKLMSGTGVGGREVKEGLRGQKSPRGVFSAEHSTPKCYAGEETGVFSSAKDIRMPTTSNSNHPIQKNPTFDGRTSWEAYITQFEIVPDLNKWKQEETAAFPTASLEGQATTVLSNLPADKRAHYSSLATALESRFGSQRQAELLRMKLRNRVRRREESLPELAEEIERLFRLAYPKASPAVLETLTKDQFVDALVDDEVRLCVVQSRSTSLRAALGTALDFVVRVVQYCLKAMVKTDTNHR